MNPYESGAPAVLVHTAGWFPDPGRAHELRYFDGISWTDHVADAGHASQAPLAKVPRVKMWILAVLSAFVFSLSTPGFRIVLPLGIGFAIWCWQTTAAALKAHQFARPALVTEIKAARIVSVCFTVVCVLQVVAQTR